MSELRLYHRDTLIGVVSNIAPEDNYEMNGIIALTADFARYKTMFDYLLANDGATPGGELPFDESYFDGWSLVDESGARKPIDLPSIENNEIIWRE